ncbi:hypothetical protein NEF87_001457 [Candidatus Lokiarchaeum ossiferum]|uniref:Uncharacterized protein n=1 Tax=Candidatus Lokiarchaeum ossiferum TaxID=2951803 RepID=A0ABY6HS07_9ARCH|nr:hypothetical protein NEF87_001457 [Candidatus Lokiarchaeum sp. B-35]
MEKNQVLLNLIKIVREDPSVSYLQELDPRTEIYVHEMNKTDLIYLNQEYPNFLPAENSTIFSINVISSKMMEGSGYKKFRFYLDPSGKILKRIES